MPKKPWLGVEIVILGWLALITAHSAEGMKVGSLDGPVTREEVDSFKAYMQTVEPAPDNIGNQWAQGHSGMMVKALGLMYEVTKDQAILDRMIYFCDAVLSERNDLAPAPVGQHKDWLGNIPPAWPNVDAETIASAAGEQGDPIGHIAYCARLILSTPSLWNKPVAIGDKHQFGITYLERAMTYVARGDDALDKFVFPCLLDLSQDDHYLWAGQRPSDRPDRAESGPVPWNQQMMFSYGIQNLAQSHEILKDNPDLVAKYDAIVGANIKWFFDTVTRYNSPKTGHPCYNWAYALPATSGEDSNHASLDIAGMITAFASGRYGLKEEDMVPFANTVVDVMTLGPGEYAGQVDGKNGTKKHAMETNKIRNGYILLAAFSPQAYTALLQPTMGSGRTGDPLGFARFIWVKNRIHPNL